MGIDSVLYPVELPTGRKVEFKQFTFDDRIAVARQYTGTPRELGYTMEELMAASSIVKIDGVPVVDDYGNQMEFGADPIHLFATWDYQEVQFFLEVFMTICFLDEKIRAQAQAAAKKLMESMANRQAPGGRPSPAKAPGSSS